VKRRKKMNKNQIKIVEIKKNKIKKKTKKGKKIHEIFIIE